MNTWVSLLSARFKLARLAGGADNFENGFGTSIFVYFLHAPLDLSNTYILRVVRLLRPALHNQYNRFTLLYTSVEHIGAHRPRLSFTRCSEATVRPHRPQIRRGGFCT